MLMVKYLSRFKLESFFLLFLWAKGLTYRSHIPKLRSTVEDSTMEVLK
jgi:hypothetical protein